MTPRDETAIKADVDTVGRLSMALLQQLFDRGMEPEVAAMAMLAAAAKALRMTCGPDDAAHIMRALADEVETDRRRFDA